MGTFLNTGKTTVTHSTEAKSIVEIYDSWPAPIRNIFALYFEGAIVGDGGDTRLRYNYHPVEGWSVSHEMPVTHCECKSNISLSLIHI